MLSFRALNFKSWVHRITYLCKGKHYILATRMALYGQLHPFDSSLEDWTTFIKRARLYFAANGITEDTKKQGVLLLPSCAPKTFTMIKSIVAPKKTVEVSYKDLK